MRQWYEANLGLNTNQYGAVFEFYRGGDSTQKGFLQWSPFKETTTYFGPSTKEFMINYRVANMDTLIGIGTSVAYLYSVFVVLFPEIRQLLNFSEATYFDVTIVVIGFVIFGKYLEYFRGHSDSKPALK